MIICYNIQYRYWDTVNVMAYQKALCSLPKPLLRDDFLEINWINNDKYINKIYNDI